MIAVCGCFWHFKDNNSICREMTLELPNNKFVESRAIAKHSNDG